MELNLNSAVLPKPMIMSPLKTPLKPFIINSAITQIPQIPNPSIEKEKWLTLESNEIYVIRNENINKTNEWIYYKLQREKLLTKRVKTKNNFNFIIFFKLFSLILLLKKMKRKK